MSNDSKQPGSRPQGVTLTPEQARSRRSRNIAIGLAIGALVVILYVLAMVRMGPGSIPTTLR